MNHIASLTQLGPDDLHRFLRGIEYPISKENILNIAREHGASDDFMSALQSLFKNSFDTPEELLQFFEEQKSLHELDKGGEFS